MSRDSRSTAVHQSILHSLVKIVSEQQAEPQQPLAHEAEASALTRTVELLLSWVLHHSHRPTTVLVLKALRQLAGFAATRALVPAHVSRLCEVWKEAIVTAATATTTTAAATTTPTRSQASSDDGERLVTALSAFLFKVAMHEKPVVRHDASVYARLLELLARDERVRFASDWRAYVVAREASCHCLHQLSAVLFERLAHKVENERFGFWLKALAELSQAEASLQQFARDSSTSGSKQQQQQQESEEKARDSNGSSELQVVLSRAASLLSSATMTVQAASSDATPFLFQQQYLQLRVRIIEAMAAVCSSLVLFPPPPRRPTSAQRDELDAQLESGRAPGWSVKWTAHAQVFRTLCDASERLVYSFFDIDRASLHILSSYV